MLKNFYKSACFALTSTILLSQFACSTPTNPQSNTVNTTDQKTSGTNIQPGTYEKDTVTVTQPNAFLLTQKNNNGTVNPVVPEDLKSVTINGKVIAASSISLNKAKFSTKATGDLTLSFKDGKYVIEGISDDTQLNISFQLNDSTTPVTLPNTTLAKLSGDLRVEITRNESGEVTGFTGGINKDGSIDPSQPVFSFDNSTKTLIVIGNGNKTTYSVEETQTELTVNSKSSEAVQNTQSTATELVGSVSKPSPVAPFVGKWKFNALTAIGKLAISQNGSGTIGYSASIENSKPAFKGAFNGSVNYTETSTVNSLDISSTVNGKSIKGNIQITGDNSLTLTLSATDETAVKPFIGVPLTLERDL